jgi:hypothetical protein
VTSLPTGPSAADAPLDPKHGGATTALVVGIVALGGFVLCLPALAGPFAWFLGARARREIDAHPGRWPNRAEATAGMVMGIVTTVALVLVVLLMVVLVVVSAATFDGGGTSGNEPARSV